MRRGLWIAGSALLALLVVELVPLPFLWIFLGIFAVGLAASIRSRRTALRILCLNVAACGLILGVAEGVYAKRALRQARPREAGASIAAAVRHENLDGGEAIAVPDEVLGYAPIPDSRIAGSRYEDGKPIYDVVYTIGPDGLRRSPPAGGGEPAGCILFFGDSFTFGEGVEDDQTTPYVLGLRTDGRYHVLNLAYQGYGPHQMLAALEHGRVDALLDCEPRYVIYQAILAHVKRSAGLSSHDHHGPRYRIGGDGEPVYDGHFDDPHRAGSPSDEPRSILRDRLSRSFLFDELWRGTAVYGEQIDLLVSILDASRRRVEQRWPGCEFHVFFWNERYQLKTLQLERALARSGLRVHRIGDILPDYLDDKLKYWIAPSDRHPNVLAHQRIADYIAERILLTDSSWSRRTPARPRSRRRRSPGS